MQHAQLKRVFLPCRRIRFSTTLAEISGAVTNHYIFFEEIKLNQFNNMQINSYYLIQYFFIFY